MVLKIVTAAVADTESTPTSIRPPIRAASTVPIPPGAGPQDPTALNIKKINTACQNGIFIPTANRHK